MKVIAQIDLFWQVVWWLGIAGWLLVVIPTVVMVANRLIEALVRIRAEASDALEHGLLVAGNLDPLPELETTRDLVKDLGGGLDRYAAALQPKLAPGRPRGNLP